MKDSDPFNQKLKQQLDQIPVDEKTTQRLDQARLSAMETLDKQTQPASSIYQLRPAFAFATVAAIAFAVLLMLGAPEVELPNTEVDNLEILTAEDDLEMYRDLEFYWWLEQQLDSQQT
jgi:hypothetical protein